MKRIEYKNSDKKECEKGQKGSSSITGSTRLKLQETGADGAMLLLSTLLCTDEDTDAITRFCDMSLVTLVVGMGSHSRDLRMEREMRQKIR